MVRDTVDIAYFREGETILEPGHRAVAPVRRHQGPRLAVRRRRAGRHLRPERLLRRPLAGRRPREQPLRRRRGGAGLPARARPTVNALISRNATFGALLFSDLSNKLGALAQRHSAARDAGADDVAGRRGVPAPGARRRRRRPTSSPSRADAGAAHQQRAGARRRRGSASSPTPGCSARSSTAGRSARCRCASWRRFELVTIAPDAPLFDALALMIQHQVHRLVVADGERIVGLLEQLDLLSFLSNHSYLITRADRRRRRTSTRWRAGGRADHALRRAAVPRRHPGRPDRQAGAGAQRQAVRARLAADRAARRWSPTAACS